GRHEKAVREEAEEVLADGVLWIEQLLVAGEGGLVRPPLRRESHRREAGLDRGDQHPGQRYGGIKQHEHEKDAPGPPPSVDPHAAPGLTSWDGRGNRAHAFPSFRSLP